FEMMKPIPRKLNLCMIFVMLLLAYSSSSLSAQTRGEEEMAALEEVLGTSVNRKGDTLAVRARLDSVKLLAEAARRGALQWACSMLMADGFSIAFDRVKPITDRYYRLARELVSSPKTRELLQVGLMRQGYYHFIYRDVSRAIPFFLRADDMDQDVDLGKVPN